jgi:hypothetical protein
LPDYRDTAAWIPSYSIVLVLLLVVVLDSWGIDAAPKQIEYEYDDEYEYD